MLHAWCISGPTGPQGTVYTKHSQTTYIPDCPPGHISLWTGYSFLHTEDGDRAHVLDLGRVIYTSNTHMAILLFSN